MLLSLYQAVSVQFDNGSHGPLLLRRPTLPFQTEKLWLRLPFAFYFCCRRTYIEHFNVAFSTPHLEYFSTTIFGSRRMTSSADKLWDQERAVFLAA